jgi:hypothetical protein
MKKPGWFVRKIKAETYFSQFLIAAIATILLIRLVLKLTDYPQLGPVAGIHVAHVLWGGLLMLAAILISFSFIGGGALQFAVLLGGTGFGMFIDEVGKFLTHDNNYFFQPSVALIYFILILIFLTQKLLFRGSDFSEREYLLNALEEIQEAALTDLDEEEKKKTQLYLKKCNPKIPLVLMLSDLIHQSHPISKAGPGTFSRFRTLLRHFYYQVTALPGFSTAVILFFLGELVVTLAITLTLVFFRELDLQQIYDIRIVGRIAEKLQYLTFVDWAHLASSWIAAVFVVLGVIQIRRSRVRAFQMFEKSILVSIFLTQIFVFYKEQFSALVGLFVNILIWSALQYMIEQERLRRQKP